MVQTYIIHVSNDVQGCDLTIHHALIVPVYSNTPRFHNIPWYFKYYRTREIVHDKNERQNNVEFVQMLFL